MDKILSVRIDESVLYKISFLSQRFHVSKKKIIESAVQHYALKIEAAHREDVFSQTHGTWKRKESAVDLVNQVKSKFRNLS